MRIADYRDILVGEYFLDLLIDVLLVELKTVKLDDAHPRLEIKRVAHGL